jgi:hypothetical protein
MSWLKRRGQSLDYIPLFTFLALRRILLNVGAALRKGKSEVSSNGLTKKESIVDIDQPLTEDAC